MTPPDRIVVKKAGARWMVLIPWVRSPPPVFDTFDEARVFASWVGDARRP